MKRLQAKFFWPAVALLNFLMIGCGGNGNAPSLPAPPPAQISANVDKAAANPGDVITFTLSAEYEKNAELKLPEIAERFAGFRIVSSGDSTPEKNGDRISVARWYKIQADIASSYVIEPVEVAYHLPGEEVITLKTPKIFIQIESLLKQDDGAQNIRDIKRPISVSPGYKTFLSIAVALAAIAASLMLGKWIFERYRRKRAAAALARKPAHEEAMEAIRNLLLQRLVEQGRIQEFYFQISFILRRYMERRFNIAAVDFTTEEILGVVDERDGLIDGETKPVLVEFLVETDLVKFAKRLPAQNEIENLIQQTMAFIEKTAPDAAQEAARQDSEEAHEHVPV